MITSSPMLAAMRLGVEAVERRSDFEANAMNLQRARDEAQRVEEARQRGRRDAKREPEDQA